MVAHTHNKHFDQLNITTVHPAMENNGSESPQTMELKTQRQTLSAQETRIPSFLSLSDRQSSKYKFGRGRIDRGLM